MEDNKKANIICVISLVCMLLPVLLERVEIAKILGITQMEIPKFEAVISNIAGAAIIAGIVLIIYVRVKYPANIFGKVLMWIYIVAAVVIFLAILLLILTCATACGAIDNNYQSFCDGCRALE